jgi:hypothetical protein
MSKDWRRLHRVRGVSGGLPKNHQVPWLIYKAKTEDRRRRVSSIGPVLQVGLTNVRRRSPETSKRRTSVGIARLSSRLSKFADVGHPSDGAKIMIPKVPFGGVYPSVRT